MGYKDSRTSHLLLLLSLIVFSACRTNPPGPPPSRAMYYWKTSFQLSDFEKNWLQTHHIEQLWVRFFDVDWNATQQDAMPIGVLQWNDSLPINYPIVPVVFITNTCIRQLPDAQVGKLAFRIHQLVSQQQQFIPDSMRVSAIQIDCDWTASTRTRYFALLDSLRLLRPKDQFTATIRLHQLKQMSKTGVPPVDRGLLMVYNMGNLQQASARNSILDPADLMPYLDALPHYPIPLDMALPTFSWMLQFRGQQFVGILRDVEADAVAKNAAFVSAGANRFAATTNTELNGYAIQSGDVLRWEDAPFENLVRVADELKKHWKNTPNWVALYHLDSIPLSKYRQHDLETVLERLR